VVDLNLTACGLTAAAARIVLPRLGSLRRLCLSHNPQLTSTGLSQLWANSSAAALIELYTRNCGLDDDLFSLLESEHGRQSCSRVATWDLAENHLTAQSMLQLATFWHESTMTTVPDDDDRPLLVGAQWTNLNLSYNPLGPTGVVQLLSGLHRLAADTPPIGSWTELDLSHTQCGIEGAVAAVRWSPAPSLRLFSNDLGADGFQALAEHWTNEDSSSSGLQSLDLAGNGASETAVANLLTALCPRANYTPVPLLTTLVVGGNAGGPSVEQAVQRLQQLRPNLDVARDKMFHG
jgi:hypothetical protein